MTCKIRKKEEYFPRGLNDSAMMTTHTKRYMCHGMLFKKGWGGSKVPSHLVTDNFSHLLESLRVLSGSTCSLTKASTQRNWEGWKVPSHLLTANNSHSQTHSHQVDVISLHELLSFWGNAEGLWLQILTSTIHCKFLKWNFSKHH